MSNTLKLARMRVEGELIEYIPEIHNKLFKNLSGECERPGINR